MRMSNYKDHFLPEDSRMETVEVISCINFSAFAFKIDEHVCYMSHLRV